MAIQLSYTSTHGVVAAKAYHHINSVNLINLTNGSEALASIEVYQTQQDYAAGSSSLDNISYVFTMDITDSGQNPSKQAYTALTSNSATKDSGGSSSKKGMGEIGYDGKDAKPV